MTVMESRSDPRDSQDPQPPTCRAALESGATVVWLSGEHDLSTLTLLCDVLSRQFSANDDDLVVDLSEVTFMDCSTLGVLVRGAFWMSGQQRWLSLRSPSRCVRRLLDVCGLNNLLDTRSSASDQSPAAIPDGLKLRPEWIRRGW